MDFAQSAVDRPSGDRRRWSGSTYPGTLMRPDAQAHLRLAVDELGFRYIRFHAIFHDILGTVAASWGHLWGHIFLDDSRDTDSMRSSSPLSAPIAISGSLIKSLKHR